MCKNPSDNASCKTTLIISPLDPVEPAVRIQFQCITDVLLTCSLFRISTKTNADLKVLIYHGQNFLLSFLCLHSLNSILPQARTRPKRNPIFWRTT
jgi:hypothetical protein